jgi:hypothetical protein
MSSCTQAAPAAVHHEPLPTFQPRWPSASMMDLGVMRLAPAGGEPGWEGGSCTDGGATCCALMGFLAGWLTALNISSSLSSLARMGLPGGVGRSRPQG